jgi:hypothetical protein
MNELNAEAVQSCARKLADQKTCDVFLYHGDIERSSDLAFINCVYSTKSRDGCILVLTTNGGDPDAAYKISRYLQEKYKRFEVLVAGTCKSAGTLVAIGATGLIFTPYGELGPLDVQIVEEDKISHLHSGLNISEALQTLERRALQTYMRMIQNIMQSSGGIVTFQTASKSAADVLSALYAPIFGQIDPEDVGGRTRSMRIAADYGKRLDAASTNMKPGAITKLAETYSSHSFVIDKAEATALFKNVRDADPLELELVEALGSYARWTAQNLQSPLVQCLSHDPDRKMEHEAGHRTPASAKTGTNSRGAGKSSRPEPRRAPVTDGRGDSSSAPVREAGRSERG